jgi:PKD repeat protein
MDSRNPTARFAVSVPAPSTDDTVQLFDRSEDPLNVGIAWRAWDFGDGATSVGLAPAHRYELPGEYQVTLTLATFDGRVGSDRQTLSVSAPRKQRVKKGTT